MEVRITYRSEVYIEGKDIQDVYDKFMDMKIYPEGPDKPDWVELCSVEDAETYEDYTFEFQKRGF